MKNKPVINCCEPWLILICLFMSLPTGCASLTSSNVVVAQVVEDEEGLSLEKDYIIKDKPLARLIDVLDVKAQYQGEYLEGLTIIRNQKKYTVEFEYKFEWFDEEGFPVESSVSHWTPELLYGKETKWLKSLCPKAKATGFKVMIREPNAVED